MGWEVPRLIQFMREAPDFYFDSTSQVSMPSWSRGRVTLVGDACACPSPLAGQGSSLALVGAYLLASELAAQSDPTRALASYEARVRGYVEHKQRVTRDVAAGFTPTTRFGIWSRNQSLALLRYLPATERIMRFAMRTRSAPPPPSNCPATRGLKEPIRRVHSKAPCCETRHSEGS